MRELHPICRKYAPMMDIKMICYTLGISYISAKTYLECERYDPNRAKLNKENTEALLNMMMYVPPITGQLKTKADFRRELKKATTFIKYEEVLDYYGFPLINFDRFMGGDNSALILYDCIHILHAFRIRPLNLIR